MDAAICESQRYNRPMHATRALNDLQMAAKLSCDLYMMTDDLSSYSQALSPSTATLQAIVYEVTRGPFGGL